MSEEQPQPSEGPKEAALEPLKSLEPEIASAMARLLETTPIEGMETQQAVELPAMTYRRRVGPISTATCPHGLAGFCLVCPRCPCNYLKARTLRSMITELEYGK